MSEGYSYKDFVKDEKYLNMYHGYQDRYVDNARENDKVIIQYVKEIVDESKHTLELLDIGCSTGNLLRHLKRNIPNIKLTGGDLLPETIKINQDNNSNKGSQ